MGRPQWPSARTPGSDSRDISEELRRTGSEWVAERSGVRCALAAYACFSGRQRGTNIPLRPRLEDAPQQSSWPHAAVSLIRVGSSRNGLHVWFQMNCPDASLPQHPESLSDPLNVPVRPDGVRSERVSLPTVSLDFTDWGSVLYQKIY